jgi:hypothetical protein
MTPRPPMKTSGKKKDLSMKQIHMILQGKGGVGKSFVAFLLAQHFLEREIRPICIDTDPVNQTFAGYQAFNAHKLKLMRGDDLDPRAFDQLIEQVVGAEDKSVFVIDNSSATFVPLCAWMLENKSVQFFKDAGVDLTLHSVLTGGQAMGDTMVGLDNLLKHFPGLPAVIWLNEYFGKPEKDGVSFEQSSLYKKHQDQVMALIRIPQVRKETFGFDLYYMLRQKLTFSEARIDEDISIMARQRLVMIWRDLERQISAANL